MQERDENDTNSNTCCVHAFRLKTVGRRTVGGKTTGNRMTGKMTGWHRAGQLATEEAKNEDARRALRKRCRSQLRS